jgi:hypothetical protein
MGEDEGCVIGLVNMSCWAYGFANMTNLNNTHVQIYTKYDHLQQKKM